MSDARFPPIPAERLTAEQQAVAQALVQGPRGGIRGPFAALLRNPRLADRVRALGDSIRFENSLPAMLREFAICIVARFWSARYEWHAHSRLAVELGVGQDTIDAIGAGLNPPAMSSDEALVHRFCIELLSTRTCPMRPTRRPSFASARSRCWTCWRRRGTSVSCRSSSMQRGTRCRRAGRRCRPWAPAPAPGTDHIGGVKPLRPTSMRTAVGLPSFTCAVTTTLAPGTTSAA